MFQLNIQELYRHFLCGACFAATIFNGYLLFTAHSVAVSHSVFIKAAVCLTIFLCVLFYAFQVVAYLKIENELRESQDPISFQILAMTERLKMWKAYMVALLILAVQQLGLLYFIP